MKYRNYERKNNAFLRERGAIIILVILTSALSFTLGFFVGKSGSDKGTAESVAEVAADVKISEEPRDKDLKPTEYKEIVNMPVPAAGLTDDRRPVPAGAVKNMPAAQAEPLAEELQKTFTIQVGAFRNLKEAKSLKNKLGRKGYTKLNIIKPEKKNNLFKVTVGEFAERKEADVMALKLNKAEGLKTMIISLGVTAADHAAH